jgi:hypothetical protein
MMVVGSISLVLASNTPKLPSSPLEDHQACQSEVINAATLRAQSSDLSITVLVRKPFDL